MEPISTGCSNPRSTPTSQDASRKVRVEVKSKSLILNILDQTVTFHWIDPDYNTTSIYANVPPYDYRDHNTLRIGTGAEARQIYEQCTAFPEGHILPSGEPFSTFPFPPNQEVVMTELGWNYFYCGIYQGDHCKFYNLKAKVYVFEDCEDCRGCPIHQY